MILNLSGVNNLFVHKKMLINFEGGPSDLDIYIYIHTIVRIVDMQ